MVKIFTVINLSNWWWMRPFPNRFLGARESDYRRKCSQGRKFPDSRYQYRPQQTSIPASNSQTSYQRGHRVDIGPVRTAVSNAAKTGQASNYRFSVSRRISADPESVIIGKISTLKDLPIQPSAAMELHHAGQSAVTQYSNWHYDGPADNANVSCTHIRRHFDRHRPVTYYLKFKD
jgi:hypothetical protein